MSNLRSPKPTRKLAVSYTRVSTEKQGASGVGLTAQKAAIERYASAMGYEIIQAFEETASAVGADSIERRGILREAVHLAKSSNADILVYDMARISRHSETAVALVRDTQVRIILVSTGEKMAGVSLQVASAHAEEVGRAISVNTKKALAQKKREGVKLGNTTNLPEAQRRGAEASRLKADRIASAIADFLEKTPGYTELPALKIVNLLNAAGIRSGHGKVWTVPGIRRPLAKAKKLIEERETQTMKDANPLFGMF